VIKVFNLFITYGDNFLPNPSTYDELYYELIRVSKVFEDLYTIGRCGQFKVDVRSAGQGRSPCD